MDSSALMAILREVAAGRVEPAQAARKIGASTADLEFARVDQHRALRCGFPEVVFCQGKSEAQVGAIAQEILRRHDRVLLTRVDSLQAAHVLNMIPDAVYHEDGRILHVDRAPREPEGNVVVVSAGTADGAVASEAVVTARALGARVERLSDVGVAGLHRLAPHVETLRDARVIVVVAGMEGALPSVIGGLVDRPVIGVPTSVGYGVASGGFAALFGMLSSCAAGVTVVNIDNGFGAGYAAALINRDPTPQREPS